MRVYKKEVKYFWALKKVECLLRSGEKEKAKRIMEGKGFKTKVLTDYIEKNGEFGKDNLKIELIFGGGDKFI